MRPHSHRKPWKAARQTGQTSCCYCQQEFTLLNPPTYDHLQPKREGGRLTDGYVLSCRHCNNARAFCPYEEYLEAVETERELAVREERPYRRPKWVYEPDFGYILTMESKRERKQRRKAAIAT